MMQYLITDDISALAELYRSDMELVSLERTPSCPLQQSARQILAGAHTLQARWQQGEDAPHTAEQALPKPLTPAQRQALAEEISAASDVLITLLGCTQVGVRLGTLEAPMCPRFHVDRVACRMLITLGGPATEWVPHPHVDTERLQARDHTADPIRPGAPVNRLGLGAWSLLKGSLWDDHFTGVLHRSPHEPGKRLLISLDPIFSD